MSERVAVIGLGRVGLPLALSFPDRGLEVIGVEREAPVLEEIAAGSMPFAETGTQELLERVHGSERFRTSRLVQDAAQADHIVLTLGTPAYVHIEIDISQIRGVIDDLLPVLRPYLATGRNKSRTAQLHHVSRPALYRRLEAIQGSLGVDLDDFEQAASVHIALLAHDAQQG